MLNSGRLPLVSPNEASACSTEKEENGKRTNSSDDERKLCNSISCSPPTLGIHHLAACASCAHIRLQRFMVAASYSCHLAKAAGSTARTFAGRNVVVTNIRAQLASSSVQLASTPGAPRLLSYSPASHQREDDIRFEAASSAGPSRQTRPSLPRDALQLKADQPDDAPTLEYLDSLMPKRRLKRSDRRSSSSSKPPYGATDQHDAQEARIWDRTHDAVNASFTRDQLLALAREAGLRGSYSTKVKKEELVRRILVHRFGLEDVAERQARLRKEEREKVNEFVQFEPAQLFLLLSNGVAALRNEAGKRQVSIFPTTPAGASAPVNALGFWIKGKQEDVINMQRWASEFKTTISERIDRIDSPHFSTPEASLYQDHLTGSVIRFVSRSSRCFIELADESSPDRLALRMRFVDPADAERAASMLRHYLAQRRASSRRLSAASYHDNLSSLRQYSLLPFAASEPLPWICQAEDAAYGTAGQMAFRASLIPDQDSMMLPQPTSADAEPPRILAWNERGEIEMQEPFRNLLDLSNRSIASNQFVVEKRFSATFGHILFSGNPVGDATVNPSEAEGQALAPLDPLASPRPGVWPLEHLVDYLQKLRRAGVDEAKRFIPSSLFRSHKGTSSAAWLERNGWALEAQEEELRVLSYRSEGEVTDRVLNVELATDGRVGSISWRGCGEADLMMPDKPFDLRLEAFSDEALPTDVASSSALQAFAAGLRDGTSSSAPSRIDWSTPSSAEPQGLVLEASTRVVRTRWTRVGPDRSETIGGDDWDEPLTDEPAELVKDSSSHKLELIREVVGEEDDQIGRETMKLQWSSGSGFPAWQEVTAAIEPLLFRNGARPIRA